MRENRDKGGIAYDSPRENSKGYLFRATKGNSVLEDPFVGSAVHNRLKSYVRAINSQMRAKLCIVLGVVAL